MYIYLRLTLVHAKAGKTRKEIPDHHPDVESDKFIVMPNHVHGIVIINNPVGDGHARPDNNLSAITGSYISAVTKRINHLNDGGSFKWQRFFYDHVICTEELLKNIREYIINNPLKWDDDGNNIKNYMVTGQACLTPTGCDKTHKKLKSITNQCSGL